MKTLRIKDICDKGSSSLKQKDVENQNGAYPVFGASGLIGKIDIYHQNKDYIAIVKDGSGIGRVTFMPAFSSVIGTLQYILPKEGFNIKYISYCLQSLDLAHYKQGAAIPHIYFSDYGEYEVHVEENPDDQQRIVSYLDAEFAKIEALKANAEKQLQAAKDLFQAALKELLTPKEGWVNGILSDIAIIMHGKNQKDVQNELGHYPIYGSGGTIMGYADDYLCEAGTTILGRKGTINNPQYIGTRFWNVDTAFGISAKYDNDNKFLFYLIKLEDWTKRNTGTTLPSLTQTVIANVPISFPLKDEQQRIAARLDALSANVKALQSNYTVTITLCNDLKQALLKKVFG